MAKTILADNTWLPLKPSILDPQEYTFFSFYIRTFHAQTLMINFPMTINSTFSNMYFSSLPKPNAKEAPFIHLTYYFIIMFSYLIFK